MSDKIGTYKPFTYPEIAIDGRPFRKGEQQSNRNVGKNHFVVVPAFLPKGFDLEAELNKLRKVANESKKPSKDASK